MMMLFTTLLYLVLPASILASDAPCYFPDGSRAFNYTSCSSADVPSHCCSRESICLTNGFCISTVHTYTLTRATCTDSTWPSDVCKNPCSGIDFTDNSGCTLPLLANLGNEVLYCPNSIVANSSSSVGCYDNYDPFSVKQAEIITDKAVLTNASCAADVLNPSITATATVAPQTGGATAAATTTVTAAPGSGSSGSGSSSSGNGENHDAAIGAGVGVPLGVLALLAVGWALAERKKRYALIHQTQHMMLASNVAGAGAAGYKPEGYAEFQELSGQGALQELEAKRGS